MHKVVRVASRKGTMTLLEEVALGVIGQRGIEEQSKCIECMSKYSRRYINNNNNTRARST